MSGFLGLGGNSKIDKGMDMSKNIFNTGMDWGNESRTSGQENVNQGLTTLKGVQDYFKTIMSGNRNETAAALAPEINQLNDQYDTVRTDKSTFGTARGGGVAAPMVNMDMNKLKTIDDAIFAQRPQAAGAVAELGQAQSNIGLSELTQALQALGMSEEAAGMYAQTALNRKAQNTQGWMNALKRGSSVAGAFSK